VDQAIQAIGAKFGKVEVVSMGSSLKICLLAEGEADIYPRFAPTCEWDTGAAHAILLAAGGDIFDTSFQSLRYNGKSDLINPHFIAIADKAYGWQELLAPSMV
jgi:3'(2'), 5'-bisphosphate nucleotidase